MFYPNVFERIIRQSTIASHVSVPAGAINKLLFAEGNQLSLVKKPRTYELENMQSNKIIFKKW